MNTKQVKHVVLVSLLGLSLTVLAADWKTSIANANHGEGQQDKPAATQDKAAAPDKPAEGKRRQRLRPMPWN